MSGRTDGWLGGWPGGGRTTGRTSRAGGRTGEQVGRYRIALPGPEWRALRMIFHDFYYRPTPCGSVTGLAPHRRPPARLFAPPPRPSARKSLRPAPMPGCDSVSGIMRPFFFVYNPMVCRSAVKVLRRLCARPSFENLVCHILLFVQRDGLSVL